MFDAVRQLADQLRPTGSESDAELLGQFVAAGDETAFAAILHRHGPMVFGVCRRLARSHHDAEDAFQAAFLVLAARADAVRPPERLGAWLHGVAVNVARKTRRRVLVGPAVPDVPSRDVRHSRTYEPDDLIVLHAELARLPDRYRLPLILCHLEGQSRRDAATALGWPEGTVSGRMARGLKLLGDRLRRQGFGLPAAVGLSVVVPAELVAATTARAVLIAAGLAGVPVQLVPLTAGAAPMFAFRRLAVPLTALLIGTGGLFALPATDPPPPPAAKPAVRPAPGWVEVAKLTRPEAVERIAFGSSGVAVADRGGTLVFWKADFGGDAEQVLEGGAGEGHTQSVERLMFDSGNRWLYCILNGGRALFRLNASDMSGGHGVSGETPDYHDFAPDGQTFAMRFGWQPKWGWLSPNVWKGEPASEARAALGAGKDVQFDHEVGRCALSADNAHFAVGLANGTVQMVGRPELRKGTIMPVASGSPVELAFSPDSNRLAVVEPGGAVVLFAHGTGMKLATLPAAATVVAWHPDGNVLATAGADKTVRLWDAATGKAGQVLRGHTEAVGAVAFSPDGKRLTSGSADKTARVWEFRP